MEMPKEMETGTSTGLDHWQALAPNEYLAESYGFMVDRVGLLFLLPSELNFIFLKHIHVLALPYQSSSCTTRDVNQIFGEQWTTNRILGSWQDAEYALGCAFRAYSSL
jgi:hypothetical protein